MQQLLNEIKNCKKLSELEAILLTTPKGLLKIFLREIEKKYDELSKIKSASKMAVKPPNDV